MALLCWYRWQVDIITAFLNTDLEEEVCARPPLPVRLPKGQVWKLRRALYGLVQAPRAWYRLVRK